MSTFIQICVIRTSFSKRMANFDKMYSELDSHWIAGVQLISGWSYHGK